MDEWAARWNIPPEAITELCQSALHVSEGGDIRSEGHLQSVLRLEAARKHVYLFRNNVGAGKMAKGGFVRWGLCNDSLSVNDRYKSADLIGIERIPITADMVGQHVGRFLSVEVKRTTWGYTGSPEEQAQQRWAALINSQGGRAIITNRDGVI